MISINSNASLLQLNDPSIEKIRSDLGTKSPIQVTDSRSKELSILDLNEMIPGYMIHEQQKIISLDTLCKSDKICIHKNKQMITDYQLESHFKDIFEPYSTLLSIKDNYISLYRGPTLVELTKNLRNVTLLKPLYGKVTIYIFNPKHEKDIKGLEPKSIKKWGIKLDLDPTTTIYIPPEWYYLYESTGDVVITHIEADTYLTYPYNYIRRN